MAKTFNAPVYWKVSDDLIRVQVAVADKKNFAPLKRSRRTRVVVESFRTDGRSDETVFETTPQVIKDLRIACELLRDSKPSKEERTREKAEKQPRKRIDREEIRRLALEQTSPFNASLIQKKTSASLPMVRLLLGSMVKEGVLESIPKKGYVPVLV